MTRPLAALGRRRRHGRGDRAARRPVRHAVAARRAGRAPPAVASADRCPLRCAHWPSACSARATRVLVGAPPRLPAQGALIVEAVHRIVGELNRKHTRRRAVDRRRQRRGHGEPGVRLAVGPAAAHRAPGRAGWSTNRCASTPTRLLADRARSMRCCGWRASTPSRRRRTPRCRSSCSAIPALAARCSRPGTRLHPGHDARHRQRRPPVPHRRHRADAAARRARRRLPTRRRGGAAAAAGAAAEERRMSATLLRGGQRDRPDERASTAVRDIVVRDGRIVAPAARRDLSTDDDRRQRLRRDGRRHRHAHAHRRRQGQPRAHADGRGPPRRRRPAGRCPTTRSSSPPAATARRARWPPATATSRWATPRPSSRRWCRATRAMPTWRWATCRCSTTAPT